MAREINPAKDVDIATFLASLSARNQAAVEEIRAQKEAGTRRRPSERVVLRGPAPDPDWRPLLLDKIAELVDESLEGRSPMCFQFAALVRAGLYVMGTRSTAMHGSVQYRRADGSWMTWEHAWVEAAGDVVIDGNVDTLHENPVVGAGLDPAPYWGPRKDVPSDRRIPLVARRLPAANGEDDEDVVKFWRPDLLAWMKEAGLVRPGGEEGR